MPGEGRLTPLSAFDPRAGRGVASGAPQGGGADNLRLGGYRAKARASSANRPRGRLRVLCGELCFQVGPEGDVKEVEVATRGDELKHLEDGEAAAAQGDMIPNVRPGLDVCDRPGVGFSPRD